MNAVTIINHSCFELLLTTKPVIKLQSLHRGSLWFFLDQCFYAHSAHVMQDCYDDTSQEILQHGSEGEETLHRIPVKEDVRKSSL